MARTCNGGRLVERRMQRLRSDDVLRVHLGAVVNRVEPGELGGGHLKLILFTQQSDL